MGDGFDGDGVLREEVSIRAEATSASGGGVSSGVPTTCWVDAPNCTPSPWLLEAGVVMAGLIGPPVGILAAFGVFNFDLLGVNGMAEGRAELGGLVLSPLDTGGDVTA